MATDMCNNREGARARGFRGRGRGDSHSKLFFNCQKEGLKARSCPHKTKESGETEQPLNSTVNNHIGLYLCIPDSICVFRTLSVGNGHNGEGSK